MEIIKTSEAPEAIGPYSQAVTTGDLVFCSGQIPLDPATMTLVGDTVAEQTTQVLKPGGSSKSRRQRTGQSCKNHGLPERYERLRRNEQRLCRILRQP